MPLQTAVAILAMELTTAEKADRLRTLQEWRGKMRNSADSRHKWVKDDCAACPCQVKDSQNGKLASHPAEAIEVLRKFWSRIWYRPRTPLNDAFNAWTVAIHPGDLPGELQWSPFTPQELAHQAQRMKQSSAGLDGCAGHGLACWPDIAWTQYATLVNSWLEKGQFPAAWCELRQVHLLKENVQYKEHCPVDKLRPIVIESALWRVLASAWVRRSEAQAWVRAWVPAEAFGGIAEKSVDDALARFHTEKSGQIPQPWSALTLPNALTMSLLPLH